MPELWNRHTQPTRTVQDKWLAGNKTIITFSQEPITTSLCLPQIYHWWQCHSASLSNNPPKAGFCWIKLFLGSPLSLPVCSSAALPILKTWVYFYGIRTFSQKALIEEHCTNIKKFLLPWCYYLKTWQTKETSEKNRLKLKLKGRNLITIMH